MEIFSKEISFLALEDIFHNAVTDLPAPLLCPTPDDVLFKLHKLFQYSVNGLSFVFS